MRELTNFSQHRETPLSKPSDSCRSLRAWLFLLAWVGASAAAAPPNAAPGGSAITILEGSATVLYDTDRRVAVEGLRLAPSAIVETGPGTGLLRIESDDGAVIDMGPETRVMLSPPGFNARGNRAPALYLLQGWAKLSTVAGETTASSLVAPGLDVRELKGVSVGFVSRDETLLFLESGEAQLIERGDGKSAAPLRLKNTEFYSRVGTDKGSISSRPKAPVLQRLPRAFRDTLPRRAAVFKNRNVEAKTLAPPSYAELQAWLTAEPALRRQFPRRFAARAREPEFRRALIANLAASPEWRPVLFPPPPKPLPVAPASSAVGYVR